MFSSELFYARTLSATAAISDPDATRRAFALVSLSHPRLSYEGWVRFLRRATRTKSGKAGVIFIEDPRGYPHALFRYAVEAKPSLAAAEDGSVRVLRLSDLVVADIAGSCLLPSIAAQGERLARALDCQTILIELPGRLRDRADGLAGYEPVAGGVISKSLAPRSPWNAAEIDTGALARGRLA
ncbi:hypothetical protein [Hansschlegelia plantiphila]|nr:hypothetical protein [Hansschlegelia plantiphila]